MKYLKTYENVKNTPKVGDWIILNLVDESWSKKFIKFSKDRMFNINSIVSEPEEYGEYIIDVEGYKGYTINNQEQDYQVSVYIGEIVHFGTKKDCEIYIQANKYNL